jgi:hypothetical protein
LESADAVCDPSVIGRTIRLNGHAFTIVGVAERSFIGTMPDAPAVWLPLMMRDAIIGAGRLAPRRVALVAECEDVDGIGPSKTGHHPAASRFRHA